MTLGERLLAIHAAFRRAGMPHAFGGAIALAYWTEEPRGTRDLDVNVFVPITDAAAVLAALPDGVRRTAGDERALAKDGQRRLFWDDTPIDVFLDYAPVHTEAAEHVRMVAFAGQEIPVLGPVELATFKAMFDRTKDWADIEAMVDAGQLDVALVVEQLVAMVGDADPRVERLRRLSA
jgi:hypothetical protein